MSTMGCFFGFGAIIIKGGKMPVYNNKGGKRISAKMNEQ